jgi:hypothetical protein
MNRLRYSSVLVAGLFGSIILLLAGCASDPLMTGEPKDWVGHTADELRAALGDPRRVISQPDGSEVWEYFETGNYVRENRSPGNYENLSRYRIKNGVVKSWFVERSEDGRVVRRDH